MLFLWRGLVKILVGASNHFGAVGRVGRAGIGMFVGAFEGSNIAQVHSTSFTEKYARGATLAQILATSAITCIMP